MSSAGWETTRQPTLFVLWALVGAGACLAVLGMASIGLFVAPVVGLGAWAVARTAGVDRRGDRADLGVGPLRPARPPGQGRAARPTPP